MILFLAKLSIIASVIYLLTKVLYPIYKPMSKKQKRGTRSYFKSKKALEKKEKRDFKRTIFAKKYLSHFLSDSTRIRYQKIIDRLELGITPEVLRLMQFEYSLLGVVISLIMLSANRMMGSFSCVLIVVGWLYPVNSYEEEIEKKNKNIAFDFPSFYGMLYYQYAKSVNLHLVDVVKDYLPNANPDMAEELGVMIDNIDYGEEYALKQLKKRVPLHYIIKFCDIIETRLKGYDNVSQMTYLKNEIDEFRIHNLESELDRRQAKNERIQLALIVILVVYIVIYYLFMIISSIELFQ